MNPVTNQTSMRVYASDNDQYRTEPNEEQTRAGVVPLDTLPAAWWNWLWNKITSNNNAGLLSITDLRTEIGNVLTNAGITANAQVTNQLAQAIILIHQRKPFFDDQSQPVPGSVISSANRNSVSVDTQTGQMTVNALSDWASQSSVKAVIDNLIGGGTSSIADLEQAISDETTARENADGDLNSLTTTDKTDLVSAINEVDGHADDNAEAIGDLSSLSTTDKTDLVSAINEVDGHADDNAEAIGDLSSLTTTDKTDLVSAINEVNAKSITYATTEFDTGKKWVNGETIYGQVLQNLSRYLQGDSTDFNSTYIVRAFIVYQNTLYVGVASHGVYTSTDGLTFTQVTSLPIGSSVTSFTIYRGRLYAGTNQGLFVAHQAGANFIQSSFPSTYSVRGLLVFNDILYVSTTNHGIYTSTDGGSTFTQNTSFPTGYSPNRAIIYRDTLYVGTASHGIYTSTDGSTFTQNTSFPTDYTVNSFTIYHDRLYVGTISHGIYIGTSQGGFYQNTSFPSTYTAFDFIVHHDTLYAGTDSHGIYTSTDGDIFIQDTSSFPTDYTVRAFVSAFSDELLYIGTASHGIYILSELYASAIISNISTLLNIQIYSSNTLLGYIKATLTNSYIILNLSSATDAPTQAIIEYTKTT